MTPDIDNTPTTPDSPTAKALEAMVQRVGSVEIRIGGLEDTTKRILLTLTGHLDRELAQQQARSLWPIAPGGKVSKARLVALIATVAASIIAGVAAQWGIPLGG